MYRIIICALCSSNFSNITGFYLIDTITTEALKIVTEKGFKPYVYQSQNVDGYNNDEIYRKYFGRVKYIK